jgi:NAD(P)H-quinone oxidoreductase subunit N
LLLQLVEDSNMALFITGNKLIRDLETHGAIAMQVPLEGGFEGRYKRRVRAAGYATQFVAAPGMGDLASYLTGIHGVRPAHVGKNPIRTYFLPPFVQYHLDHLPPNSKGLLLWFYDGHRLARQEYDYLCQLTRSEKRLKVVVEVGGDRKVSWKPLEEVVAAAA